MASAGDASHGRDDPVKAWLRSNIPHVVRELAAGGAAGAVAKTCVAPLERTKILLMTGRSKSSALGTLRLILAAEGLPGLFRGNGASCLRIVPYAAIHFSVYEAYRRLLVEHFLPPPPPPPPQATVAVAAGAASGGVGGSSGNALTGASPHCRPGWGEAAVAAAGDGGGGGTGQSDGDLRPAVTAAAAAVSHPALHPPPHPPHHPPDTLKHQHQHHQQHLGEDVPPTPLSSSIEVSATAVITTVEEEQREEAAEEEQEQELAAPSPAAAGTAAAAKQQAREASGHRRRRPGPVLDLVAGSAAGATAVLMTYPLDMVRTRLAWAMDGASRGRQATAAVAGAEASASVASAAAAGAKGVAAATAAPAAATPAAHHSRIVPMLVHTARHEGVVGLYRGLAPTLYGIMPYAGLKFYVYGSLKQWYRDSIQPAAASAAAAATGKGAGGGGGERLPVPYMLAFGGLSGLLAQTVTYPLDVIRRRMQVYGIQQEASAAAGGGPAAMAAAGTRQRLTTWGVGVTIVQQEGIRGLFRGLSLNYVKVVPSTAIGFTVYDTFKSYLGVTGNM